MGLLLVWKHSQVYRVKTWYLVCLWYLSDIRIRIENWPKCEVNLPPFPPAVPPTCGVWVWFLMPTLNITLRSLLFSDQKTNKLHKTKVCHTIINIKLKVWSCIVARMIVLIKHIIAIYSLNVWFLRVFFLHLFLPSRLLHWLWYGPDQKRWADHCGGSTQRRLQWSGGLS